MSKRALPLRAVHHALGARTPPKPATTHPRLCRLEQPPHQRETTRTTTGTTGKRTRGPRRDVPLTTAAATMGHNGPADGAPSGLSPVAAVIVAAMTTAAAVAATDENDPTLSAQCQSSVVMMHPLGPKVSIDQVYEITDEIIGEGGYCVVHRGVDRQTGEAVAIKILSKNETPAREFWTEVDVLRTAGHHPNIMQLRGVFENDDCWFIVQELASEGELFDHLIENGAYSEQQASAAIRELCDALHYLHRKGIVHGDIKPENILLHHGRMCLVDFGVSFRLGERFFADSQLTGTVAYAAPETLLHTVPASVGHDEEPDYKLGPNADMFALGVVLYILLCGSHPFDPYNNLTDEEIRQRIIKGKFSRHTRAWQSISRPARDLIEKLLIPDPEDRLTSAEALAHPWLAKDADLSREPIRNSAELLERFQRGRRRLRASILGVLLLDALDEDEKDDSRRLFSNAKGANWGISSSLAALSEKADALISTLDIFDREKKGFITKNDLARVSKQLGRPLSDSELNEMLVGATGDPEKVASAINSIGYDDVKLAISTLRSASFEPGEVIIREGNTGHHVYLLLDGEVEVSCKNPIKNNKIHEKNMAVEGFGGLLARKLATPPKEPKEAEEVVLKRLQKGSFFGEIELLRPDGMLHPRIASYTCASTTGSSACKVLQLVADDFLNVSGIYTSINDKVESSARLHTQEQLIKCVEATKGSVKKRTFKPGEFIYHEGESCDSFFIIVEGEVQVLRQHEQVVVEDLCEGDYFPLGVSGQTTECKIHTRHYSVRCSKPTKVIEIGGETFRSFLHSNQFMASYFSQEIKRREQMRLEKHIKRASK